MGNQNNQVSGLVSEIFKPENLALLRKIDRFVIMAAGLIVVAALGAIATFHDQSLVALVLAPVSMLIVAGLVIFVHWRTVTTTPLEADLQRRAAAGQAVNGDWWQLVRGDNGLNLAHVSITISEAPGGHAIHGTAFNENGEREANFSSDMVAVKTSIPIEILYEYRGNIYLTRPSEKVAGLVRLRFEAVSGVQQPLEAEGAIAPSNPKKPNFFGMWRDLELIKFTTEESRRFCEDSSCLPELVNEAFHRFRE